MKSFREYVLGQVDDEDATRRLRFGGEFKTPTMDTPAEFLFYCSDRAHLARVLDTFDQHHSQTIYSGLRLSFE